MSGVMKDRRIVAMAFGDYNHFRDSQENVSPADGGHAEDGLNYGPSSAHPAVAITGFGDDSVNPLSKRIDAANFFFLITKNNSDPFNLPN
jgi:hypothetical protein